MSLQQMQRPPSGAIPPPPEPEQRDATRLRIVSALLALFVLYSVLESLLWSRSLWGAHALGFLPRPWLILAPLAWLALLPPVRDRLTALAERWRPTSRAVRALPWLLGGVAALAFWLLRERHLFWGDALPLSINIPKGQAFHPDEPLTLWLQHTLYAVGGGRWSAVAAMAAGSALAGAAFVGLACAWLLRRCEATSTALLALAVLVTQGYTALFYGHVENYSYFAVALLGFVASGVDFLEDRGPALPPLLWALLAYAFHLLGGLLLPPALVLVGVGLRRKRTRTQILLAALVALGLGFSAALLARGLYGGEWPWLQLWRGVGKVLSQPRDMNAAAFFSLRHVADAWSHVVQMGPLSLALVAVLCVILPSRRFLTQPAGAFAVVSALALYGPALLTGQGNLGAARNWDLFAAPSAAVTCLGLLLVTDTFSPRFARRLLVSVLAVSVFHLAPWVALNLSVERAVARVEALPLGRGRPQMMLGTYYLNSGELALAAQHFRRALTEDSLNVNAVSGLGLALARSGRLAEAEPPLARAAALKPTVPQYRRDLALLHFTREHWGAAAEQLEHALLLDPADVPSWLSLAECERRLGHPDSATFALLAGHQHNPSSQELQGALADAYALWVASAGQRGDLAGFARAWAGFAYQFPRDPRVTEWRPRAEAMLRGAPPKRR